MENVFLGERTARDIDKQVAKVLKDLGNPEPPLLLPEIRELLRLDLRYYQSGTDGAVAEFLHHLTMAGKQVIAKPTRIFEAIKKWDLKALYLPDRKRILLDESLPKLKKRWGEAHEIGHSITPWHEQYMHGDDKVTLRPECHAQIEAEANYAAGRMLFLQDRFAAEIASVTPSLDNVKVLAKRYGNTITCTLWRAVEHLAVPALGLVGAHPLHPEDDFDPVLPFRHFVRSPSFVRQFPGITAPMLFQVLRNYCSYKTRGPLGAAEVVLADANGDQHVFTFETFSNSYEALTLGLYRRKHVHVAAC